MVYILTQSISVKICKKECQEFITIRFDMKYIYMSILEFFHSINSPIYLLFELQELILEGIQLDTLIAWESQV